jgi:hypothetical protein
VRVDYLVDIAAACRYEGVREPVLVFLRLLGDPVRIVAPHPGLPRRLQRLAMTNEAEGFYSIFPIKLIANQMTPTS